MSVFQTNSRMTFKGFTKFKLCLMKLFFDKCHEFEQVMCTIYSFSEEKQNLMIL